MLQVCQIGHEHGILRNFLPYERVLGVDAHAASVQTLPFSSLSATVLLPGRQSSSSLQLQACPASMKNAPELQLA
jgi:hypothetical protein